MLFEVKAESKVAVIIPFFNEEDVLESCIESILNQKSLPEELILIDDESTDQSLEIALSAQSRHPTLITVLCLGKLGPGRARNIAAKNCRSRILAFMDADCVADSEWLLNLEQSFLDSRVDGCGGPHLCPLQATPFQTKVDRFFQRTAILTDFYKKEASRELVAVKHNPLCNVAYRKDLFLKLGGFREDLFPGEDYEFDYRMRQAGHRLYFNSQARVFHHRPFNIECFQKTLRSYGKAQAKIVQLHGPHRLIHFFGVGTPIFFLFSLVSFGVTQAWELCFIPLVLSLWMSAPSYSRFGSAELYLELRHWLIGFVEGMISQRR